MYFFFFFFSSSQNVFLRHMWPILHLKNLRIWGIKKTTNLQEIEKRKPKSPAPQTGSRDVYLMLCIAEVQRCTSCVLTLQLLYYLNQDARLLPVKKGSACLHLRCDCAISSMVNKGQKTQPKQMTGKHPQSLRLA